MFIEVTLPGGNKVFVSIDTIASLIQLDDHPTANCQIVLKPNHSVHSYDVIAGYEEVKELIDDETRSGGVSF